MKKRRFVSSILILFAVGILVGCSGGKKVTKVGMAVPPPANQPYTIGPLDKIEIKVWEQPEFSDTFTIDSRGMLRFPLVGEIDCLGIAPYELADLLEEELLRYIRNPQVRVEIAEYNSQKIIIMGAVAKQGIYYVKSRLTIMEAIALAGGFTEGAKTTQVYIGRGELGNLQLLRINVKEIMVRARKDENILLQNGDIVFVPTTFVANVNKAIQQLSPSLNMYNTVEDLGQ